MSIISCVDISKDKKENRMRPFSFPNVFQGMLQTLVHWFAFQVGYNTYQVIIIFVHYPFA